MLLFRDTVNVWPERLYPLMLVCSHVTFADIVVLYEHTYAGFILFLGLMIDRLHHYIRELRQLRKTMEATKKQNRAFEDIKNGSSSESIAVAEEISTLKKKIELLESECEKKSEDAKAAEASVSSLKKQSEELLMEYDRLLEDNQNLRNQLQSLGSQGK